MSPIPARSSIFVTATPDAPAPATTARSWPSSFPATRAALRSAASVTIAVPCWSSWKTGMSSRSPEPVFDLEAAWRGDVLQVDAAEARRERGDRRDDLVGAGAGQADRHRVDVGEPLEQQRFAFHDRHRGGGADVTQAEHGRAVGDDGDRVGHPGVVGGQLGLIGDRGAHPGDPRRVGHRQALVVGHVDDRAHADLAAAMHGEHGIGVAARITGVGKGWLNRHGFTPRLKMRMGAAMARQPEDYRLYRAEPRDGDGGVPCSHCATVLPPGDDPPEPPAHSDRRAAGICHVGWCNTRYRRQTIT